MAEHTSHQCARKCPIKIHPDAGEFVNWRTGRGRRAEGLAEGLLLGDERTLTECLTHKRHELAQINQRPPSTFQTIASAAISSMHMMVRRPMRFKSTGSSLLPRRASISGPACEAPAVF